MPGPVVAIFGPTAVGKTAVAVAVAAELRRRGEDPVAIGVDALQVYRELPILTAQPTEAERRELEHRLVGFVPVANAWSVAQHTVLAHAEIDGALGAGRVPIVVGGTGLYLRSALSDLTLAPPPPGGVREALLARADEPGGLAALHLELQDRDPRAAALMPPTDRTRVVRAHELLLAGSSLAAASTKGELWTDAMRSPTVLVGLTMERAALRARAAGRIEVMMADGVVREVRAAAAAGAGGTAAAAVGFAELLGGDVHGAVTRTRQLAKRQQTWMRRLGGVQVLDVTGREAHDTAREIVRRWVAAAGGEAPRP